MGAADAENARGAWERSTGKVRDGRRDQAARPAVNSEAERFPRH